MTQERRPSRKFTVGIVQNSCTDDVRANEEKAISLIREAARRGAQIVCLQELFRTPYFCKQEDHRFFEYAEPIPGPSTELFGKVAKEEGVVIVASLFERRAPGVYYNTAAVIDADGSYLGKYRKMHIPEDPHFYEKFYFIPGDLGYKVFDTKFARVGVLICWDQWYPEAARLTALQGAEVLFYPTAIGWHPSEKEEFGAAQDDAWRTIQRGHGIANAVYVAAPNRVGFEPDPWGKGDGIEFFGGSFVSDPFGRILAKGSHDKEEVLVVECDTALIEETRQHWPFFRDRRIDSYGPITSRYLDGEE